MIIIDLRKELKRSSRPELLIPSTFLSVP